MVAHVGVYNNNDWIVHFKEVNCMMCELYLNKDIEEKVCGFKGKNI